MGSRNWLVIHESRTFSSYSEVMQCHYPSIKSDQLGLSVFPITNEIKASGQHLNFGMTDYVWLFKKNISHVVFYKLTKFHGLIAFTSWDIGQCLHHNYFFPACDVISSGSILFWKEDNEPTFLYIFQEKTNIY